MAIADRLLISQCGNAAPGKRRLCLLKTVCCFAALTKEPVFGPRGGTEACRNSNELSLNSNAWSLLYRSFHQSVADAFLLGHVLAHELGHVLQGVARHSEEGVLKERWSAAEIQVMPTRQLRFTPHA